MSWKTPLSLVVAIALGLVTAKVGWDLVQKQHGTSGPSAKAKVAQVVVAKRDLDPGYQLTAQDVGTSSIAEELVPEKACKTVEELVGRTVISSIATGQTMFEGLLAPEGSAPGI